MKTAKLNSKKGFTIIEVVLVLAIAGLIFVMIFITLPSLQRSQRDTARKKDVDRFLAAIQTHQANNRNRLPNEINHDAPTTYPGNYVVISDTDFGRQYLNQDGYFVNPEGVVYVMYPSTYANPGEVIPNNSFTNDIFVSRGAKCAANGDIELTVAQNESRYRANSTRIAIRIKLEDGGVYCVNN